MSVGQYPLAPLLGVSENRQPDHVVHQGQRGAVALGSLNGRQDQGHVHSAGVDRLVQVTALEVSLGCGNSWIPCTGSSVVVMGVAFDLQMNEGSQTVNRYRKMEF